MYSLFDALAVDRREFAISLCNSWVSGSKCRLGGEDLHPRFVVTDSLCDVGASFNPCVASHKLERVSGLSSAWGALGERHLCPL